MRVFGDLTAILGKKHILELDEGSTVLSLTNRMAKEHGLKRQGYLGNYRVGGDDLAVLVNGRNIRLLDGPETVLHEGDEVVVFQPVAGG